MSGTAAGWRWTPQDLAKQLGEHQPTEEQAAVIAAPLEPTLVAAGAGSGKTQTLAFRVAYLVANGLVDGASVLGLTFTRKAAGELAARIRSMLGRLGLPDTGQPAVATYNSYAVGIVRDHALRLGYDPDAEVLSDGTRWQLAMEVVEGWEAEPLTGVSPATLAALVLNLADQCVDNGVEPAAAGEALAALVEDLTTKPAGVNPATGRTKSALPPGLKSAIASLGKRQAVMGLVQRYADLKRQRGQMDFADQIALAARLAVAFPVIGRAERERYQAVLLDEYQDTSGSQVKLLSTLFAGHPVMAVGDPHQSIYGWRGAQAATLARFVEDFAGAPGLDTAADAARGADPARRAAGSAAAAGAGHDAAAAAGEATTRPAGLGDGTAAVPDLAARRAPVLSLSTAWRNDQAILEAANQVAGPLRQASPIDLPQLQARPGAGPGLVETGFYATAAAEAAAVADYLVRAWRDAPPVGSRRRTAAVLCRTQRQFGLMAQALLEAGLPHELVGVGGLLAVPEVQDVVALLRCAQDPSRGDAFMRLATSPRYNLGARDLRALERLARGLARDGAPEPGSTPGVIDALAVMAEQPAEVPGLSREGRRRLTRLGHAIVQVRSQAARLAAPELVQVAERALGLDLDLMAHYGPAGRAHLQQLVLEAHGFVRQMAGAGGLTGFLDWLESEQERGRGLEPGRVEVSPDAIQVMTVHAAKGLEWDVVVVPGLVGAKFPSTPTDKLGRFTAAGWLTDASQSGGSGGLPWELRRDARDLPVFAYAAAPTVVELDEAFQDFLQAAGTHALAEERRVAYVALTRARSRLLLSGSWQVEGRTRVQEPSVFLAELVQAGLASDATWEPAPAVLEDAAEGDQSEDWTGVPGGLPAAAEPAMWPVENPLGERRAGVLAAAGQVLDQLQQLVAPAPPVAGQPAPGGAEWAISRLTSDAALAGPLASRAADLLREQVASGQGATVRLPAAVSATGLVGLLADPAQAALAWRRPLPLPPATAAQVGELFHQRAEAHLRALHGSVGEQPTLEGADEWVDQPQDETVAQRVEELMAAFAASRWATQEFSLVAAEAAMAFALGGLTTVARVDAVFRDRQGRHVVVDWKTGQPPKDGGAWPGHANQVRLYQAALARQLGVAASEVLGYVHYVPANCAVEVKPDDDYLAGIEARLAALTGSG
ncbi:MAG: ATP-dependent helicase [Bifidobacteriaceae bacterium]|jgi:DNA helicase-2/ATP-dependent DNA helicase PcrA|nr:ATP-dependent helicase [Bifidobacteriaceae bacterium]